MKVRIKGKRKPSVRVQKIVSNPRKLIGSYLTPKGERLKAKGYDEEALTKYRKNKYLKASGHVVRTINHQV